MTFFVNKSDYIEHLSISLLVDQMRKRSAASARKSMWSDMIAASPRGDRVNSGFDPLIEVSLESFRNFPIMLAGSREIFPEQRAEDDSHLSSPKTSEKE